MIRKFKKLQRYRFEKEYFGILKNPQAYGYDNLNDAQLRLLTLCEKISRINRQLNDRVDARRFRELYHAVAR